MTEREFLIILEACLLKRSGISESEIINKLNNLGVSNRFITAGIMLCNYLNTIEDKEK